MKTYRDSFAETPWTEENLSWCKPYVTEDGRIALVRCEGKYVALRYDGKDYDCSDPDQVTAFLRATLPDFDLYSGYTLDQLCDILIDALSIPETGCHQCPWNAECEAMDEPCGDQGDDEDDE